jgi:hypothetical protein
VVRTAMSPASHQGQVSQGATVTPGVPWVGAFVFEVDPTLPPGGAETDRLVFERVGDRWLIDEIVETWTGGDLDGEGTPAS